MLTVKLLSKSMEKGLNNINNKPTEDSCSYHPIGLLPSISKILEKVFERNEHNTVDPWYGINGHQSCF